MGDVKGPGKGQDPTKPSGDMPKQVKTGFAKTYTAAKAPSFQTMLEYWFPGQVTPEMVSAFEQGMMQMIQNSFNESKAQHAKVQEKIQRRIKEE